MSISERKKKVHQVQKALKVKVKMSSTQVSNVLSQNVNVLAQKVDFNASIQVTELLMKTLENAVKDFASRCVTELANLHGFNAEEAIKSIGLENVSLIRKQMAKKSSSKEKVVKEKVVKENVSKAKSIPLPFIASMVLETGCQGLNYNRGLFTQCSKKRMENGEFCEGCQKQADKNASGCPDCGTIKSRLDSGLYEFKDPKGRSPVSYIKMLEKSKLTKEQAIEEAGKNNIEIPNEHFEIIDKKSVGKRGRPKKASNVIQANDSNDLMAQLTHDDAEEVVNDNSSDNSEDSNKSKRAKLTEEEKAAKKSALEAERAQKKADNETKRKAEAEIKKAEREKLKAEIKALKDKQKAEEKALKEQMKAEEKTKKAEKKTQKEKPVAEKPVAEKPVAEKPVEAEKPAKVTVRKLVLNGTTYLRNPENNMVYDLNTREELGIYNEETKTIIPLDDDEVEEEEEEEEYEL